MAKRTLVAHHLREWAIYTFGSVNAFAVAMDMSQSAASQLLNGKYNIGIDTLKRLYALGYDVNEIMRLDNALSTKSAVKKLIESSGKIMEETHQLDIDIVPIPVFDYIKAGGKSMVLRDEPAEYIYSTKSADQSRYGVRVKGNSMEPEIKDGEIVVASKIAHIKDGNICVITFEDGDTCLRRVYFSDHSCTLVSDNKKYPPITYKKSEIKIIHKIVEKITKY
jgi:phage repressor protein C with HTH and peptisase S24 domain